MISFQSDKFLDTNIADFIIPSEKVAHVQLGNNLEHALLVLTKSGYSAIPVLDSHFHLHGLISSSMITEAILGLERIEFEKLREMKVSDVMVNETPRLRTTDKFKKAIGLLIDHPFLFVESGEGVFEGILTRRVILKQLNRHVVKYNQF